MPRNLLAVTEAFGDFGKKAITCGIIKQASASMNMFNTDIRPTRTWIVALCAAMFGKQSALNSNAC